MRMLTLRTVRLWRYMSHISALRATQPFTHSLPVNFNHALHRFTLLFQSRDLHFGHSTGFSTRGTHEYLHCAQVFVFMGDDNNREGAECQQLSF